MVQCAGVDFETVWAQALTHSLDVKRLYSNDIGNILRAYGVEAARQVSQPRARFIAV